MIPTASKSSFFFHLPQKKDSNFENSVPSHIHTKSQNAICGHSHDEMDNLGIRIYSILDIKDANKKLRINNISRNHEMHVIYPPPNETFSSLHSYFPFCLFYFVYCQLLIFPHVQIPNKNSNEYSYHKSN